MSKRRANRTTYKEWITEEGLLKIEGWARDGLINEQIAHNIGIAEGTFYRWQNEHDEIREVLKRGKEVIDRQVENALLKKALGYEYEETKIIQEKDKQGRDRIRKERVIKRALPDTTAQIFWLKNRKPAEWRDKQEVEHSGSIDVAKREEEIKERLFNE